MLFETPCQHCKDRTEDCHINCERYKKYRGEMQTVKENREKQHKSESAGFFCPAHERKAQSKNRNSYGSNKRKIKVY